MSVPLRKVVIVDDHEIFRAGLRAGLGPTVQVVGEAGSVETAIPLIAGSSRMSCCSTSTCRMAEARR